MPEQYRPSAESYLESIENRAYTELLQAQEATEAIMGEIKKVYANTRDKHQAKRIILDTLIPRYSQAQIEENRALKDWIDSIQELHQLSP